MTTDNLMIPDKFKDAETGGVKIESLLTSYAELEKKMSAQPRAPKSHADYCVNCEHGLFGVDDEMNARLHEKGFTNEQVQFVYDLAAEKMVPMVIRMAADYRADREIEKPSDKIFVSFIEGPSAGQAFIIDPEECLCPPFIARQGEADIFDRIMASGIFYGFFKPNYSA